MRNLSSLINFGIAPKITKLTVMEQGVMVPTIQQTYSMIQEIVESSRIENAPLLKCKSISRMIKSGLDGALAFKLQNPVEVIGSHTITKQDGTKGHLILKTDLVFIDVSLFKPTYVNMDEYNNIIHSQEEFQKKLELISKLEIKDEAKIQIISENLQGMADIQYDENVIKFDIFDKIVDIDTFKISTDKVCYLTDTPVKLIKSLTAVKMSGADRERKIAHYTFTS